MTWQEEAAARIAALNLPLVMDPAERRKALLDARPDKFRVTSWGKKAWQAAQREYLISIGAKLRHPIEYPHPMESPLQRAKRHAEETADRIKEAFGNK